MPESGSALASLAGDDAQTQHNRTVGNDTTGGELPFAAGAQTAAVPRKRLQQNCKLRASYRARPALRGH